VTRCAGGPPREGGAAGTGISLSFPAMELANLLAVEGELGMEHEGFRIREAQIGPQLGADLIGASVYVSHSYTRSEVPDD
jgi:hypothetical protein